MAECPNKASYNFRDLETRTAKYNPNVSINRINVFLFRFFNIPFRMKEDPFNLIGVIGSLQQQRFITAVLKVINFLLSLLLNDVAFIHYYLFILHT